MRTLKHSKTSRLHLLHHHLSKIKILQRTRRKKSRKNRTRIKRMMRMKMKKTNNNKIKFWKSSSLMLKVALWMRSFFSLHNKHRNEKEKLDEPKMLYFQKIEGDILTQCFQRGL